MGRLGYYSKLSGQAPQENDLKKKNFMRVIPILFESLEQATSMAAVTSA